MSGFIADIVTDKNTIRTSFEASLNSLIHTRLANAGLTGNKLTDTQTSIVDGIKAHMEIMSDLLIETIYTKVENKILSNLNINTNAVHGLSQDPTTKLITFSEGNIVASKSFS